MSIYFKIIKLIVLQSLWWLFVLNKNINPGLIIISSFLVVLLDFYFRRKKLSAYYFVYVLVFSMIGFASDLAFQYFQLIDYKVPIPWFMLGIWIIFVPYFEVEFAKIRNNLKLSSLLAAIAGPFAYWSVARLGIIQMETASYPWLAAFWGIYFWLSFYVFNRLIPSL